MRSENNTGPDPTAPDATGPDSTAPDPTGLEPTGLDATAPDATEPGPAGPDATAPDATEPGPAGPDATAPDVARLDARSRAAPDRDVPDRGAPDRDAGGGGSGGLSGAELLAAADRLLRGVRPGGADLWPRAAAFLLRAALEHALNEMWARVDPRMLDAPRGAQLLVLPRRLDDVRAARAAFVWAALSNACHHHTYELAPTPAELRRWHTDVAELIAAVQEA